MGQQSNKVEKRRRRQNYLGRLQLKTKEAAAATASAPSKPGKKKPVAKKAPAAEAKG